MSALLLSLPDLYNSYKSWVKKNPQLAGDYESSAKWLSYFLAGRIHNSHVLSELIYCLSKLLVLFNDCIIRKSFEVFCELSVQKLWGKTGKWFIVVVIQVFKCIARCVLIHVHKERIIENPPIPQLDRAKLQTDGNSNNKNLLNLESSESAATSFTLKHSGRIIRKIESSPPLGLRTWKPLEPEIIHHIEDKKVQQLIMTRQLIAEYIYIAKPILHLISYGMYGPKSWKPWMLSLALDVSSLQLYKSTQNMSVSSLTKSQKLQLSKRIVLLVLYLIRSPVYEKHSKNKINAFLNALSNNVPLIRLICNPLGEYLPFWQGNYFHMWST
ncbi:hypothetical protein GWI33_019289 [Rhynchophorus ferrugineus]|uniref:Peroxisomal membrane protein PEX16 n=1 Tax=Rhynchophorus ferrugineus TaxID=354439 RepID=A0A834I5N2_RHYFE|nr:hypothetical protein GWI33_019289 [Rhynchophorus ferrugineus]